MTGPEEWQGQVMPHHPSLLPGHMAWGLPQHFTWFPYLWPQHWPHLSSVLGRQASLTRVPSQTRVGTWVPRPWSLCPRVVLIVPEVVLPGTGGTGLPSRLPDSGVLLLLALAMLLCL